MNIVLLMTACITPNSSHMLKLIDINARASQYLKAIQWYFYHTPYNIVFAENSRTSLTIPQIILESDRFEYISWKEVSENPDRGKGYKEAKIHEKVIRESVLYHDADIVVKITGRLIMTNIVASINSIKHPSRKLLMSNFGWKFMYQDTRFIIAGKEAFEGLQKANKRINTTIGMEEAYAAESRRLIKNDLVHYELSKSLPKVIGVGGGTSENYSKRDLKWLKKRLEYKWYYLFHHKTIVQEIKDSFIEDGNKK